MKKSIMSILAIILSLLVMVSSISVIGVSATDVAEEVTGVVESQHNYLAYTDKSWTVSDPDAKKIVLRFSADTEVERDYDFIYIYDGNNSLVGRYTGTQLASKTVRVDGSTVHIRLTSDQTIQYYGFYAEYTVIYDEIETPDGPVWEPLETPDEPEIPTEPAETPDEPEIPTEPAETPDEPVAEVTYVHGDANGDGKVNVKDATCILKAAAGLETLDFLCALAGDVNLDGKLNVRDATVVLKYVVGIATNLPIGEIFTESEPPTAPPTEPPTAPEKDTVTIYFTDSRSWGSVYVYGFYGVEGVTAEGEPLGVYPGSAMNYVELNSNGQKVYSYEVPADIDFIKFSNGSVDGLNRRTDNIPNKNLADNAGFYPNVNYTGTKWTVGSYTYTSTETPTESETAPSTEQTTPSTEPGETPTEVPSEPEEDTITIYFSDTKYWGGVYLYAFYGVEGGSTTGKPLGDYPGAQMSYAGCDDNGFNVYKCEVPADIDYIKFSNGSVDGVNRRTDNIPKAQIYDGMFCSVGSNYSGTKWTFVIYNDSITEVPSATDDETPTIPQVQSNKIYFVNSTNWYSVSVCITEDGFTALTESRMTKTGTKINGFDVYQATISGTPGYIYFHYAGDGLRTNAVAFEGGKYFDAKSHKWYASPDDIPAPSSLSTGIYLPGSFNGWSATATEFVCKTAGSSTCYAELELEANTTYEFKIIINYSDWTSSAGLLSVTGSVSGIPFSISANSNGNVKLATNNAGKYVFEFNTSTSKLSITYP